MTERIEKKEVIRDKYKALWLSHSSISDFLNCPKLYYFRSVYKDPRTGRKMTIMNPHLALGQAVHEVVEGLSVVKVSDRLKTPLTEKLETAWKKVGGEKGGFRNLDQEMEFKQRGVKMLENLENNPGPLLKKAVKIKSAGDLPYYWFSDDENMILCGKIDWMEYLPETDSIHIIDFKTGRYEEGSSSLQLPIYLLLASNIQKRNVSKASYWYLNKDNGPVEKTMPSSDESFEKIYNVATRMKLARKLNHFPCQTNGCKHCYPFERVMKGEGEKVGISTYGQEIFVLNNK